MNALDKRLKVFQVILESITLCRQHETQEQTVFTVDERQDREYLRLGNSTIYSIGHLDSDFHLLQSATGLFINSALRHGEIGAQFAHPIRRRIQGSFESSVLTQLRKIRRDIWTKVLEHPCVQGEKGLTCLRLNSLPLVVWQPKIQISAHISQP